MSTQTSPWEDAPLGPPRGSRAALTVFKGDPVAVLREDTGDADTSLLVVGSRGRTSWRAALGSCQARWRQMRPCR